MQKSIKIDNQTVLWYTHYKSKQFQFLTDKLYAKLVQQYDSAHLAGEKRVNKK